MPRSRSSGAKPSRPGPPQAGGPPSRHLLLRLLLIAVIGLFLVAVLPAPWAFHMGGRFSPLAEWDGYGPVRTTDGGYYLLFTHLRGGVLDGHGYSDCSFSGCGALTGTAQLCTRGGHRYTFALNGTVHGWLSTNGAPATVSLTGGTPTALPKGRVVAFHGIWRGPELPLASTGSSFTEVFTRSGAIRASRSAANAGTALVVLRHGSQASFGRACQALARGLG